MEFFGITKQYDQEREDYLRYFDSIYHNGRLFDGNYTELLEEQIKEYCGCKHAIAVGSGSDALFMAIHCGIREPLGLIAAPNFTFCATGESILRSDKFVTFIDSFGSGPEKHMMDYKDLCKTFNLRLDGVVYVPLFGLTGEIRYLSDSLKEFNIPLIEDCAQSLGTKYDGKHVGTFGKAGCFSFDPTKTISSPDGGGVVITDDDSLAFKVRAMRYHGLKPDGRLIILRGGSRLLGLNSRMSEIGAAITLQQLLKIDESVAKRQIIACEYRFRLRYVPSLILPVVHPKCSPSWSKFVIEIKEEDVDPLLQFLDLYGIPARRTYKKTLSGIFGGCSQVIKREGPAEVSEHLVKSSVSLPIYPGMTEEDTTLVCDKIIEYYERKGT
jgi:dTDP-4-amino-4,6-dideoxygalactose transaminase